MQIFSVFFLFAAKMPVMRRLQIKMTPYANQSELMKDLMQWVRARERVRSTISRKRQIGKLRPLARASRAFKKRILGRLALTDVYNPGLFPLMQLSLRYELELHELALVALCARSEQLCRELEAQDKRGRWEHARTTFIISKILSRSHRKTRLIRHGVLSVTGGPAPVATLNRQVVVLLAPRAQVKGNGLPISKRISRRDLYPTQSHARPQTQTNPVYPSEQTEAVAEEQDAPRCVLRLQRPRCSFRQIELDPEILAEIRNAIDPEQRQTLMSWGLDELAQQGCKMLFHGGPGTGKTITAHAVAAQLGLPIAVVDYPSVLSKWMGESEKGIAQIFDTALLKPCVLFFDEADSLLTARLVDVDSAAASVHNRCINILLQRIEEYAQPVIFATNLAEALDPALDRRIPIKIAFPNPSPAQAVRIFEQHLGSKVPRDSSIDLPALTRGAALTGGMIRNCVLRAVRLAVSQKATALSQSHLQAALAQEMALRKGNTARRIGFQDEIAVSVRKGLAIAGGA